MQTYVQHIHKASYAHAQTHLSFAALVGLLQLGTKSTHHTYIYSQGLLRIVRVFMCVCVCVCSASTHCMHTHTYIGSRLPRCNNIIMTGAQSIYRVWSVTSELHMYHYQCTSIDVPPLNKKNYSIRTCVYMCSVEHHQASNTQLMDFRMFGPCMYVCMYVTCLELEH